MIKAVCFDLDGVFFTKSGFSDFKDSVIALGANSEKVNYYFHKEPMEEFKRGEITEGDFWEEAIKYLELSVTPDTLMNLLPQKYEINAQVLEYITHLRTKGINTCICSNNFITRINKLESKFNFLKNFDCAIFSYQVGVLKPDKEIFQVLLDILKIQPNELVCSDDSEEKLNGAKELGINCFVYSDFSSFNDYLQKLGIA